MEMVHLGSAVFTCMRIITYTYTCVHNYTLIVMMTLLLLHHTFPRHVQREYSHATHLAGKVNVAWGVYEVDKEWLAAW